MTQYGAADLMPRRSRAQLCDGQDYGRVQQCHRTCVAVASLLNLSQLWSIDQHLGWQNVSRHLVSQVNSRSRTKAPAQSDVSARNEFRGPSARNRSYTGWVGGKRVVNERLLWLQRDYWSVSGGRSLGSLGDHDCCNRPVIGLACARSQLATTIIYKLQMICRKTSQENLKNKSETLVTSALSQNHQLRRAWWHLIG